MKIRSFQKKPPRIEMLPLIDVVFIYAMLSMAVHKGMPVDLPISSEVKADKKLSLSVTVDADGDIFIDKKPVALDKVTTTLHRLSKRDKETGVLFFADRSVSYQTLFRVLDRIRQAGLERISLQAESEQQP